MPQLPKLSLSTIAGIAGAAYTGLQHAYPNSPWVAILGAALTLIVIPEEPKNKS